MITLASINFPFLSGVDEAKGMESSYEEKRGFPRRLA